MPTRPPLDEKPTANGDALLTIDLGRLVSNYKELARRSLPAKTAAVVKADAYGTGITRVAPVLAAAGVNTFFVAQAHEGGQLRQLLSSSAPSSEIFVFGGVRPETAELLRQHNLIPVLNSLDQADLWAASSREGAALPAALQVDTGMNRLGLEVSEVKELHSNPHRLDGLDLKLIMSHLACADTPDHALNQKQLVQFKNARGLLPQAPCSLANSAGILLGTEYHFDLTRPGIGLYGGNPCPSRTNPVVSIVKLEAPILQLRHVELGASIGYGATAVTDRPTRIAVISLGYGDGLPRALGAAGHFYFSGKKVKIIGRISMDLIAVDVTDIPTDEIAPGETVEIIGDQAKLEQVAEDAGTISYELLTGLGARYARYYKGEKETTGG